MTETATIYEVNPPPAAPKVLPDMQQIMLRKFLGKQVQIFIVNGVRLLGKLTAFDRFTVILDNDHLVFKHAISAIQLTDKKYYGKDPA